MKELENYRNFINLRSQVVKLGISEDIVKASQLAKQADEDIKSKFASLKKTDADRVAAEKAAKKAQDEASKSASNALKVQTTLGTLIDKLEKTANDLGISPSAIPSYKESVQAYQSLEADYNAVNSFTFSNVG
jgi:flagellin-like hook-associated protein FlgL